MRIRTTRDDVPEGDEPIDADISIDSADDVWITANDQVEISSNKLLIYQYSDGSTKMIYNINPY